MTQPKNNGAAILNVADLLPTDGEMFFVCTISGRIIFVANNLKEFLGADLTGRNLNDYLPDDTSASIIANAHSDTPFDFRCEILGKAVKGTIEVSEGHITVLLFPSTAEGKTFIRQSSAKFLARELSNSLSLMSASLELLRDQLPRLPETDMPLSILRQNVLRLLRLSRNMSDYALFQSGKLGFNPTYGDINAFCGDLWERTGKILEKLGFTVKAIFPQESVMCNFDKEKVERILLNLISNSIRSDKKHSLRLTLTNKENCVSITISDSGHGIPQNAMGSVFDLHSDSDPESHPLGGAGFGLALAKAYAELHGGSIVVSSSDFSGTAACVTLPKGEDGGDMFSSPSIDYAGGFDHILLELSTAISKDFFI